MAGWPELSTGLIKLPVCACSVQQMQSATGQKRRKTGKYGFEVIGLLTPTDAYELLRCEAAPAILQTFEIR